MNEVPPECVLAWFAAAMLAAAAVDAWQQAWARGYVAMLTGPGAGRG